jgi:hypothetical protein
MPRLGRKHRAIARLGALLRRQRKPRCAQRLAVNLHAYRTDRRWPTDGTTWCPDLMVGEAGVGAAYVRLANLQRPHILAPAAFAPADTKSQREARQRAPDRAQRVACAGQFREHKITSRPRPIRRSTYHPAALNRNRRPRTRCLSQAERRTKHGLQRDSGLDGRIYDRCSWPSLSGWIRDARVPRFQIHNRTLAVLCQPGLQPESSRKWHKSARFCGTRSDRASQELISVREARTSFWIGLFSI